MHIYNKLAVCTSVAEPAKKRHMTLKCLNILARLNPKNPKEPTSDRPVPKGSHQPQEANPANQQKLLSPKASNFTDCRRLRNTEKCFFSLG